MLAWSSSTAGTEAHGQFVDAVRPTATSSGRREMHYCVCRRLKPAKAARQRYLPEVNFRREDFLMNIADNEAELQLKDVAELCGVSTKTLRRDHDAELLDMVKRDGRWVVTVASLIVAGRYTSSTEPAAD